VNIIIIDDYPLVRKGLLSIFSSEDNIEKIQEASNVDEAMNLLIDDNFHIAIVDLKLGREDGLEIVYRARKRKINTKFIILASSVKKQDFLRAQEADVDGYILKQAYIEDIVYAFNVVARGKKFFDPDILQYKVGELEIKSVEKLTPREKDILIQIGNGLSNVKIAKKLFISENTVKKHVSNILSKLHLNDRTQAAIFVNNSSKL
jgi:two-component system nitrate/nitrite response regulator NarL